MPQPIGSVVYSVKVNGVTDLNFPVTVELHQSWGQHDMVVLKVIATKNHSYRKLLNAWPDGAAIELLWGRLPDELLTWYGYISHKSFQSENDFGSNTAQVTYYLIGTSKVMNTHKNMAWKHVSYSVMAYKIAKQNGFRCVATNTGAPVKYELQAFESDFQFLNRMADKIGFRFWVSGGTLYFIDPAVIIQGANARFIPHYLIDKVPGQRDTAVNFCTLQGDNLPGSMIANRRAWGIDVKFGGRIFDSKADGALHDIDLFNPDWFVATRGEAKQRMNAKQSRAQFWRYATVDVGGFTALYPGKVLSLDGHGIADSQQGNWLVTSVIHRLQSRTQLVNPSLDAYTTHVQMMKNQTGTLPTIKGIQPVKPEIVTCILSNNKWHSTNLNAIQEGVVQR
jgi:hypothetical protein